MNGSTDLGQKTLSALVWSYGGAIARTLLTLVIQLLVARFLGPEAFGQATAAFFVGSLGWLLAEGGFGAALVQKKEIDDHDVGFVLGWVLLLSLSAALVVVLGSSFIADWLGGAALVPLIVASGLTIPVQALSNISASLMRRNLDMRRSQLISLATYFIAYAFIGLPMAWAGAGAWSLVVAFLAFNMINLVACYLVVRHTLRPRLTGDASLRRFGLHVTGTNIANWSIENLDRLIVNRLLGTVALGQYTAAFNLSRAPANFLVNSVQSVALASASRLQAEPSRIADGYMVALSLVSLITCPLFALLSVNSDVVIHIAYGAKWDQAAPLFAAFCAGLPVFTVLAVTGPLLWAVGGVRREFAIQLAAAALILGGFMLLMRYPLSSVVWIVPLINMFRAGCVYVALKAKIGFSHARALRAVGPGLLLAGIAVVVSLASRARFEAHLALTSASLATLVLALGLLWAVPRSMLAPELARMLQQRAATSSLFAAICRPLRLMRA